MHKKRALVLWAYLSLLALAACWPKVIDESDLVLFDYTYSMEDWVIIDNWSAEFIVWDNDAFEWLEPIVRWAQKYDEFQGVINWKELYGSEYDNKLVQTYPELVITEVMWLSNPVIWDKVLTNSLGEGRILAINQDEDWYNVYVVDFNSPKTYSDLYYFVKITDIEKK